MVLKGVLDLPYIFAHLASRCVYLMLKQCCGAMPLVVCAVQQLSVLWGAHPVCGMVSTHILEEADCFCSALWFCFFILILCVCPVDAKPSHNRGLLIPLFEVQAQHEHKYSKLLRTHCDKQLNTIKQENTITWNYFIFLRKSLNNAHMSSLCCVAVKKISIHSGHWMQFFSWSNDYHFVLPCKVLHLPLVQSPE